MTKWLGRDDEGRVVDIDTEDIAVEGGAHPDLAAHLALGLEEAGTYVATNDARLSDARTPIAHTATHATGGGDELAPADIGASADGHTHGGGAPSDATYLVTTAHAGLSAEVAVGATPGGELGGTWDAPTVDATHGGGTHAATQAAAEATAAGALSSHAAAADPHTGYVREADANWIDLTDSGATTLHSHAGGGGAPADADYLVGTANGTLSGEIVVGTSPGGELGGTWASPTVDATHSGSSHAGVVSTHEGAADPHTGYQRESEKAAASGYASLDGTTKVPIAQLPTGSSGTTVAIGNDARLSDARTPLAHDIDGAAHNGFPGGTTNFLRADGTFAAPSGGGGGVTKISGNSGAFVADTTCETLTADSSGVTVTTQTTVMTVTGLGAGTYRVKGTLIWKTAATTTGIGITLNHTGTLSQFVSTWWTTTTGGAAATGIADQVTATAAGQLVEGKSERVKDTRSSFNVGTDTAGGTQLSIIEAILIVTASGDLQLKIATEVAASAATLLAGSTLEVNKTV